MNEMKLMKNCGVRRLKFITAWNIAWYKSAYGWSAGELTIRRIIIIGGI